MLQLFCRNLKEILRGSLVQQNWGLYLSPFFYFMVQCRIVQDFTISFRNLSHNLSRNHFAIYSQSITFTELFYLSTLLGVHTPLRVSEISSEFILYITSPLHLFWPRLMQLNICHTYWIFAPDSSQFAGCFSLQSMIITIYFCLSPNHASKCSVT